MAERNNIIEGKNNRFTYSIDSGVTWKFIEVPTGCYEIKSLADEIMYKLRYDSEHFNITSDISVLRCKLELTTTSCIDFGAENSINILGFNTRIVSGAGYHYSDNIININPV
jgi:hypothetical protein